MTILHKSLSVNEINQLELLLNGAFAPVEGYLNQADHSSVLKHNRLSNGRLWPLPFVLALSPAEKREAQLSGRIALLDQEQRTLAEVKVENFHRLNSELVELAQGFDAKVSEDTWYVSGKVDSLQKILHPAFNSIRHKPTGLRQQTQAWQSVIAVAASPSVEQEDLQRACQWLEGGQVDGGILVQLNVDESAEDYHEQVRALRQQVKCNKGHQVKLSLLPCVQGLNTQQCLLLQTLVSRNYGATAFVINSAIPADISRWLQQHRDEIGLEIIPAAKNTVTAHEKLAA